MHGVDKFQLGVAVTGIDPTITSGSVDAVTFDVNMAVDVNATNLAAHHAVLFTPSPDLAGNVHVPLPEDGALSPGADEYVGHTFLIVDANGRAGYQAGADFVFDVTGGTLTGLSVVDFGGIPSP